METLTSRHQVLNSCSENRAWAAAATTDKTGNKTGMNIKEWSVAVSAEAETEP
jgi:hypothetical protein